MTREELDAALGMIGRRAGRPLKLDARGACGLSVGRPGVEIVVEWIAKSRSAAVHCGWPGPLSFTTPQMAPTLLVTHLAGASTEGCAFWATPKGELRIGASLFPPRLEADHLADAIDRVRRVALRCASRPEGV